MMYGRGKSSPVIVAGKPANKAQPDSVTAAESVERRAGAKGNANQPARTGLSAGSRVVLALASIRQAARLDCQYPRCLVGGDRGSGGVLAEVEAVLGIGSESVHLRLNEFLVVQEPVVTDKQVEHGHG